MPTTSGSRKKAGKKKTAKTAAKKVAKKAATKKKAGKKAAAKRTSTPVGKSISPEQRHAMIREAAYYLAEQRGFDSSNDMDDWLAAEAYIDGQLGG